MGTVIENSSISIYPNPVQNDLNLSNSNDLVTYEIFNFAGQIIISNVRFENNRINVFGLSNGVYILKVTRNWVNQLV